MVDVTSFLSSLSPAEKLKLIGDLWDDLSSDPQNVPWHDCIKKSLIDARRTCYRIRMQSLRRRSLKADCENVVAAEIRYKADVFDDLNEAAAWYDKRRLGFGRRVFRMFF